MADNPALNRAASYGLPVIPLYIWAPEEEGNWPPGGASRWWIHHSLICLSADLEKRGARLIIRRGKSIDELRNIIRESEAVAVVWNRRYEPEIIKRDSNIRNTLSREGLEVEEFNGNLLYEPREIENNSGKPYQVFTPYFKKCLAVNEDFITIPALKRIPVPEKWPKSLPISELELEPKLNWADKFKKYWEPGEKGAKKELGKFNREPLFKYKDERDHPSLKGTSRLSPYLCNGEISPRQIWHAVKQSARKAEVKKGAVPAMVYLRQLIWREFSYHLLYHFPDTPLKPLRTEFGAFPWKSAKKSLEAWQKGETGYPIVDAGMRELWETGWMHNRVRMITASFLTKDLLISWQEGARWFWDTLVDADLANNTFGWQWTAGCGADAAPYFRIFNPVLQGEKFDPSGSYVRSWIPELAGLPDRYIHKPWKARVDDLEYPEPIIDHGVARNLALKIYQDKILNKK